MTIPDNPGSALWQWAARAPLPVVMALVIVLAGWVYAVDGNATDAKKDAAVALESKRDVARRIETMDDKLDKVLELVARLDERAQSAARADAKVATDLAATKAAAGPAKKEKK